MRHCYKVILRDSKGQIHLQQLNSIYDSTVNVKVEQ